MINKKLMINTKKTSLGLELGSTRIKSVLIGVNGEVISTGYHNWENKKNNGIWTYDEADIWKGIQSSYKKLKKNVKDNYGVTLHNIGSIGVSAMMHGYLPIDNSGNLLVPFRTWRNSITHYSSEYLTNLFKFNIPQRWSVAHLHHAITNKEKHLNHLEYITTLAGYVHFKLTGKKLLGIGDASGMFPISSKTSKYDEDKTRLFNKEIKKYGYKFTIDNILPSIVEAGKIAGHLTPDGVKLIDIDGDLNSGIPFVAPEGDSSTGMVATNSIKTNTGNISAGTSIFSMIVLKNELSKVYKDIDIVMTPTGLPVAMVHSNNCTTEINAWVNLFKDFLEIFDYEIDNDILFDKLFKAALNFKDYDINIVSYGYHSSENITKINNGHPILLRKPGSYLSIDELIYSLIAGSFATLSIGLEILTEEGIKIETIVGHGGIFKTKGVAERVLSAAVKSKISLLDTANEGGAWGMAILAQYLQFSDKMTLEKFLDTVIFSNTRSREYQATESEVEKFEQYINIYKKGLALEKRSSKIQWR